MSSPAPSPAKILLSTPNFSNGSGLPNTALLISVTLVAIALSVVAMASVVFFLWRRSRQQGRAPPAETVAPSPSEPSVFACRKPVVIINPSEESISYGRRDSSFFPSFFRLGRRSTTAEKDEPLPDACEGGYYIKGQPGFFAVDLEMGGIAEDVSKAGSSHQSSEGSLHSSTIPSEISLHNRNTESIQAPVSIRS